jgi:pimeloyl-ACP methyl ester carboxylesterase
LNPQSAAQHETVSVSAPPVTLAGDLTLPSAARGMVLFAHGSGSSRLSPRNRYVADSLNERNLATLLFDLLTEPEEQIDLRTRELRFDIALLARRLIQAIDWTHNHPATAALDLGLFGASTGAAAALIAAAERPDLVKAIVCRGGRPDLAPSALPEVCAATLLIVGSLDREVIELNRQAQQQMAAPCELAIVAGASHLFEEKGKLEEVARLAGEWFATHLAPSSPSPLD